VITKGKVIEIIFSGFLYSKIRRLHCSKTIPEETFKVSTSIAEVEKSDDLPFIDENEAELDAAIEAAAPELDHQVHVTKIQVR